VWIFQCFKKGEQNTHRRKYGEKLWSRDWRKGHPESAPPENPTHIQSPKPETIEDAKKCLLMEVWYNCLLRGSARAWQIQRQMLAANHWTELGVPDGRVGEGTEGAEGVYSPTEGATLSTGQTPLRSRELDHQPKSTHGGTHGSGHICGRGWPCWTSLGGCAMLHCRGMPEQEDRSGWTREHPHRGRGMEDGLGGFWRGNLEKRKHLKCK
jgi:hypothetical protein